MKELLMELLLAVVTVAVPILTAHAVTFIGKARDEAEARTNSEYIKEIADAVSMAVAMTSQTYVDALKKAGSFTEAAQMEAAQKALAAGIAAISPAAAAFIEHAYGDVKKYLMARIEAEVRAQKIQKKQDV